MPIFEVETLVKGEDWRFRLSSNDADEAFALASRYAESNEYYGVRVMILIGGIVWRAVRIAYDYTAGRTS